MNKYKKTYCNPLKIENFPRGYGEIPHRSISDPTVLWYEGKWYMYPSYNMAYVSEDFVTWEHREISPCDLGWGPTVLEYNGKFYLYGRTGELYVSDNPLGPFEKLGEIRFDNGNILGASIDPMIFADDDGKVYIYYTVGDLTPGKVSDISIWGTELDGNNLTRAIGKPVRLISFDSSHKWECFGERNQNTALGWIEGVWMTKQKGRYYLIYSASGTAFGTYAMGAYYSDKGPLEGFVYQKKNPICNNRYGLVRGGGHGCITEGPGGTLWAFYTCPLGYSARFERVIGMEAVTIDENGEIMVSEITDSPQWAPGVKENPYFENDTGLLPLTYSCVTSATSCKEGRDSLYAVDENLTTWWQPESDDDEKAITVNLAERYKISAMRIIWREAGLDYENGNLPGPFKYVVDVSKDGKSWERVVDKSKNTKDFHIDYETFETVEANYARLTVLDSPEGIEPAVVSFTVFGVLAF